MDSITQDWEERKIGGGSSVKRIKGKGEQTSDHDGILDNGNKGVVVSTDKKLVSGVNKAHIGTDHQRIAKLDRENEVAPPSKIAPTVGKAIQRGRMDKNLTQKDVAQMINEKASVLQDYESGNAIPNPQILGKLERALNVKLRGTDIGKKLPGPKKSSV